MEGHPVYICRLYNLYILKDFEFVHPLLMPKEGVKGALAMASKVAANDARLLREKSTGAKK